MKNSFLNLKNKFVIIIGGNGLIGKELVNEYSNLGAYYVLGALTLVNDQAAIALPWLFQSVS